MSNLDVRWVAGLVGPLRVRPGSKVTLPGDFDPGARFGVRKKNDGARLLMQGVELLAEYQDRLAAQDTYGVLVVLQGMDAAGKDSTIRHVMSGVNPQGVHVSSFKVPSAEELGHDYLWRLARRLPARGEIGIFNRSHYEEVLAVRVHPEDLDREKLPPESTRPRRMAAAVPGNQRLGTLPDRQRDPASSNCSSTCRKRSSGPVSCSGLTSRRRTGNSPRPIHGSVSTGMKYQHAYAQMLTHTSTEWAPWHVLPADHKWLTRICAAAVIAQTLIDIDPRYPVPDAATRQELLQARAELEAETS